MTTAITFNDHWLNKTANKSERAAPAKLLAIVWHETQNKSGKAAQTLDYNVPSKVGTSYDFLIGRDGTIYRYLDHRKYVSWDTGESEWMIDGITYHNWNLNVLTVGVELDGPCDGTPITAAQLDSAARLAVWLHETEGIKLDRAHQLTHAEIARKRTTNKRSDPRGVTPEQIIRRALDLVAVDFPELWGHHYEYFERSGIAAAWRPLAAQLGAAVSDETKDARGHIWRLFEHGAVEHDPVTGLNVPYLPRKT